MEKSFATFGRQALPILWDWGEVVPIARASGGLEVALDWTGNAAEKVAGLTNNGGQVQAIDATQHTLPDQSADVWFTDPHYYDAVPYADLSDFFMVWLKRTVREPPLLKDPFGPDNPLLPKTREAVQDETKLYDGQPKNRQWFEAAMGRSFSEGRRILDQDEVGLVVFAHKTTEGVGSLAFGHDSRRLDDNRLMAHRY